MLFKSPRVLISSKALCPWLPNPLPHQWMTSWMTCLGEDVKLLFSLHTVASLLGGLGGWLNLPTIKILLSCRAKIVAAGQVLALKNAFCTI